MSAGALAELLLEVGLASTNKQESDYIDTPRTQSAPITIGARGTHGTLSDSSDATSRLLRVSRQETAGVEFETRAQVSRTGAAVAGSAGNSSARNLAAKRLRLAAEIEELSAERVLALDDAAPDELLQMSDEELRAYALALITTDERKAGRVPTGWTALAMCAGCGPVWLWPGVPHVLACPWCWNRRQGLPFPNTAHPFGSSQEGWPEGNSDPAGWVDSDRRDDLTRSSTR